MEVKTRLGGSGFITLVLERYGDKIDVNLRLAYLQVLKDIPPQPPTPESLDTNGIGLAELHLKFYEVWNAPIWEMIGKEHGSCWEALVSGLGDGTIVMRKMIRSPSGRMRQTAFDLGSATITAVDSGEEVHVDEYILPNEIVVTGHTRHMIEDYEPKPDSGTEISMTS